MRGRYKKIHRARANSMLCPSYLALPAVYVVMCGYPIEEPACTWVDDETTCENCLRAMEYKKRRDSAHV